MRIGARQLPMAVEPKQFVLGRGMSNSSRLHTIRVPWRKACAVLPTVALMGAGVALAAPGNNLMGVAVSSHSPAIVVPDQALTFPAPATSPGTLPMTVPEAPAPQAPGSVSLKGALPFSSSVGTLDSTGIPVRALEGYRRAVSLIDSADPACHIDWALLAAIGRVESNHGRFGGSQLNSAGVATPAIIGISLDGSNGTARITDTDGGVLDGDRVYDRAVGPMQFIPSTWRVVGVDADGDGVKNPQSITDAATATAIYLCSGPGDLRRPGDLRAAIMRYNASDSYVQMVTAIAATYRLGVSALPAPADSSLSTSAAGTSGAKTTKPATVVAGGKLGSILATMVRQTPATTLVVPTTISATAAPALPIPGATTVPTTTSAPAPTTTSAPAPTTTSAPAPTTTSAPAPTTTSAPAPTTTSAPAPTTTDPCLPAPTTTAPATAVPCATSTPTA